MVLSRKLRPFAWDHTMPSPENAPIPGRLEDKMASTHPSPKKALFVYDFRLYRQGTNVRVRHFPYSLWEQRYLPVFSEIEILGREAITQAENLDSLPVSSGPGLTFTSLPNLSSLANQLIKRRYVQRILATKISTADLTIIRLPSELGYLAAQQAKRLGRPYVIEAVGCPFDALWNYGSLKAKLWAPIAKQRMRLALRQAPFVIYVTERFLQARYPTNGSAIACSNVTLDATASTPPAHVGVPLSNKPKITLGLIGYLGTDYKGADTAIQAIAQLQRPNVVLELVGGGDHSRLKQLASKLRVQNQIRFLGQLPHEAVKDWLSTLDLYLQPSRTEGLPRALLEAMSLGLPAIGSTAGGIPELLPLSDLHPPSDSRRLTALIERAILDDAWRLEASKRNLVTAQKYLFSTLNNRRQTFLKAAMQGAQFNY